jgi:hypothetical protein
MMTTALSGDSIQYWETSATLTQCVTVGRTNARGVTMWHAPHGRACTIVLHQTIHPGKKSPIERVRFLPNGTRLINGPGNGFVKIWGGG